MVKKRHWVIIRMYGSSGIEDTAELMTELLAVKVPFNRIQFKQEVTQMAIAFKLNERPIEGAVLSMEEIKKVGYSLKLMERLEYHSKPLKVELL